MPSKKFYRDGITGELLVTRAVAIPTDKHNLMVHMEFDEKGELVRFSVAFEDWNPFLPSAPITHQRDRYKVAIQDEWASRSPALEETLCTLSPGWSGSWEELVAVSRSLA